MRCSLVVFLEEYFLYIIFPTPSYYIQVFLSAEGLAWPNLKCPYKWFYYSIISKLTILLLDLLQVPSDVSFETLTAELKSLGLEE